MDGGFRALWATADAEFGAGTRRQILTFRLWHNRWEHHEDNATRLFSTCLAMAAWPEVLFTFDQAHGWRTGYCDTRAIRQ